MKSRTTFSLVAASTLWLAGCGNADMTFREVPGEKKGAAGAEANPEGTSADQTGVIPSGEGQEGTNGNANGTTQVVVEGQSGEQATVLSVEVDAGASEVDGGNGETIAEGSDSATGGEAPASDAETGDKTASNDDKYGDYDDDDDKDYGHGNKDKKKNEDKVAGSHDSDKASCAAKHDAAAEKVKVVGAEKSVVLKGDELLMIRVTGNKSSVKISSMAAEGAAAVRGICIFAAGNQTTVSAALNINVGSLSYFGTGNRSKGHVTIGEGYELAKLMVSLRGNQAALKVDGEGKYECGIPELKGNGPLFECKN